MDLSLFPTQLGRLTTESWFGDERAVAYLFEYDTLGRLKKSTDQANDFTPGVTREYVFGYDNLDRLTTTVYDVDTRVYTMTSEYDAASQRTKRVLGYDPGPPYFPVAELLVDQWQYDDLGRVKTATQGGHYTVLPKRADFTYRANGQLNDIKRYNGLVVDANSLIVTSNYAYDGAGRLDSLRHYNRTGSQLDGWKYNYDAASRIEAIDAFFAGEDVNYTYDKAGQLKVADYAVGAIVPDESYGYDEFGNRKTDGAFTNTLTANNRLMSDDTFAYTYDDEGNRTSRVRHTSGHADKTTLYTWDYRNRLTQVVHKNDAGAVTMRVKYQYDAWNRMTRRVYDQDGDTGSQLVTSDWYLHDGSQRVMHLLGDYNVSHFYMLNPVTGEVLFDQTAQNYATLTDHLGSVHDLVNTSGQVVNHIVYDAFGGRASETNPQGGAVPHKSQYGFTGEFFEVATGLTYHHHRWYDPAAARWISEDPISFGGGDSNLNRYVGNQVTTHVDPSGLWSPFVALPPRASDVAASRRYQNPAIEAAKGVVQGALNSANGVTDAGIGTLNLCSAVNNFAGNLPFNPIPGLGMFESPMLPDWDWSRGLAVDEPDWVHNTSKFAGGTGIMAGAGAVWGRAGSLAEQGGLNLYKRWHPTSTRGGDWRVGDRFFNLADKRSPQANWMQNASALRNEMRSCRPIYDTYVDDVGNLIPTRGFLNAERNLLQNRGWTYNPSSRSWTAPLPY